MRPLLRPRVIVLVGFLLALSGCLHLQSPRLPVARYAEDIGNVYVSAYPVVSWGDISSALAPNRQWKIPDAESHALTVTSAETSQAASVLAGALGINFAKTVPASGGTTATPPDGTNLPKSADPASALGTLTGLSVADPYQQLVSVTSLFQQAAILDGQIASQYVPRGYGAYLVTFQINVQPTRRNWSYNTVVDITLMPSPLAAALESSTTVTDNATSLPPVIIKPAILTDAIEISSTQRSLQQIRQVLLQLSASLPKAGAALNGGLRQSLFETQSGYSNNSLITQGVVDDATLRVRLGAESDGTGALVLRPRTYNVSVLVFTRSGEIGTRRFGIQQLAAVTHFYFTPTIDLAEKSKVHPGNNVETSARRSFGDLAQQVAQTLKRFGYPLLEKNCEQLPAGRPPRTAPFDPKDSEDVNTHAQFLRTVVHGDYAAAQRCLNFEVATTLQDQERFYRVLSEIHDLQVTTRYSRLTIPLPGDGTPRLPDPGQYALVSDDTDSQTEKVTLYGGQNLTAAELHPRATLNDNQDAWLLPKEVIVNAKLPQPSVSMTFNLPSALHPLTSQKPSAAGTTAGGQLKILEILWGPDYGDNPCGSSTHQCYSKFLRADSASSTSAVCKGLLKQTSSTIRGSGSSTQRYSGSVNVTLGDFSCATTIPPGQASPPFEAPFFLVPFGADILISTLPTGCVSVSGSGFRISAAAKCVVELGLINMQPGVPVTLGVKDSKQNTLPGSLQWTVVDVEHGR